MAERAIRHVVTDCRTKLSAANIQVTNAGENRIRISPAIYNDMEDVDKLLNALA